MDRASDNRYFDADGRLHVRRSNLTKANICSYRGREIPKWQALGLDAERIYKLWRHPDELAKAVDTFNNQPILCDHAPVDADQHRPELIVGSTGTDAAFDGTYITNSQVIWARDSITGVLSNRKREISSGYRYAADMTPGEVGGLHYDGIMRDIAANHIALVIEGRAGPDVTVGDEHMKFKSRKALMLSGALVGLVRPLLAADAKVDLTPALDGIDAKNMDARKDAIAAKVVELVTPVLATDAKIEVADVVSAVTAIGLIAMDEADEIPAKDAEPPKPKPDVPALDKDKPDDKDKDDKPAGMDSAAVQTLIDKAVAETRAESAAIEKARDAVFPHVGKVVGMDSAAAIYRVALDAAKIDLTDVPESAFGPLVANLRTAEPAPVRAFDHAGAGKLGEVVPNLPPVRRI